MNQQLNVLKGWGIFLVIVGHASLNAGMLRDFIYLFHVPLFFLLSGYFMKDKSMAAILPFLKKKIKRLYLPFFYWGVPFILLTSTFAMWGLIGNSTEFSLITCVKEILKMAVFKYTAPFLGGFWFLKSLLVSSIIFALFRKLADIIGGKHEQLTFFFLCFLSYVAGIALAKAGFELNFYTTLNRELCVVFLLYLGYSYRKFESCLAYNIWGFLLSFAFLLAATPLFSFDFGAMKFNCVELLATTFVGFYFSMMVSHYIYKYSPRLSRLMIYMGSNTITLLALHFLAFKVVTILYVKTAGLTAEHLADFPCLHVETSYCLIAAYVFVGCAIPLAYQLVFDKAKSLFNGKES